jgi:hypothetical protein
MEKNSRPPGHGQPGKPDFVIRVENHGPIIDRVCLGVAADYSFLAGTAESEQRLCDFLFDAAARVDSAYGEIAIRSDKYLPGGSLLEAHHLDLDMDAKRRNWSTHPRDELKGYSWVTIVPKELAVQLGGNDALLATGAFVEVKSLPTGGLWLKATERLGDYDVQAAERVFEAVRAVLVKGKPSQLFDGAPVPLADRES